MSNKNVDAKPLSHLLEKVHLGGLNEECVLEITKGIGSIYAVDRSGGVFLYAEEPINMDDMSIGIRGIGLLCKFLSEEGEYEFTIKKDRMSVKRKKHGTISITLLERDEVPTRPNDADEILEMFKSMPICESTINKSGIDKLIYYTSLVGSEGVVLKVNEGKMKISSPEHNEQRFLFPLGSVTGELKEANTEVNAAHLKAILKLVSMDKEPKIQIGSLEGSFPVMISQNENVWILNPRE